MSPKTWSFNFFIISSIFFLSTLSNRLHTRRSYNPQFRNYRLFSKYLSEDSVFYNIVGKESVYTDSLPSTYNSDSLDKYFENKQNILFSRSTTYLKELTILLYNCFLETLKTPYLFRVPGNSNLSGRFMIEGTYTPPNFVDLLLGYNYNALDYSESNFFVKSSGDSNSIQIKYNNPVIRHHDEGIDLSSNQLFALKPLSSRYAIHLRSFLSRLGPTFVKLGQIISSRPDVFPISLTNELKSLVDSVTPFSAEIAQDVIRSDIGVGFASCFSPTTPPVAAASLGQVYKIDYLGRTMAVKIKRPDADILIATDFHIIKKVAQFIDRLGLLKTNIASAVDEFASRIYEELDYRNEAANIELFRKLYGKDVIVPLLYREFSSERVIAMSWIEGEKLIGDTVEDSSVSYGIQSERKLFDLGLVKQGIQATLSQLIDKGVLHADPHLGNILKVKIPSGFGAKKAAFKLAYIDFGLVAKVPLGVRESLVCSVIHLIQRNFTALALEFDSLMLLSKEDVMKNLTDISLELERVANNILEYPLDFDVNKLSKVDDTLKENVFIPLPRVKFDSIILSLLYIASKFRFTIPPYFLNNARAIGTLEGMALQVDPDFNLLTVLYPFAIKKLLLDPSPKIRNTLKSFILKDSKIKWKTLIRYFFDASGLGLSKFKLLFDLLRSKFVLKIMIQDFLFRVKSLKFYSS